MKLYGAIYESPPEPNKNPHFPENTPNESTTASTTEKKDKWLWVIVLIALMIAAGYLMTRRS